ncbi:coiled-coil domain-containing protein 57 isoform X2 [Amphiprion ocellaris]|nr:coiled-coil domain-containing protein 57 isoform X2 [Amphiprion ocellaris]
MMTDVYLCPSCTMQSDEDSGLRDLEARLVSKERELKELQAVRVHQLESSLIKAQKECSSLREHYKQLREDFLFNLAILDERDRELDKYDAITARALARDHNRQAELNQHQMQIAKMEEQRAREAEERQEELSKYRHNAFQHRLQLDKLKRLMAAEIKKQMKEYDQMKLDLQHRIRDVEGQLARQRQEMTAAFDSELRQQEHEFNVKMDEMRAVVLSHEIKVKLLCKETEVHCQAQLQATQALKASKELCQQMKTQLQHKDQELKDIVAIKDNRIKELEDKLKSMETNLKKEKDDHIKKHEDVVLALKNRDAQLEVQHQAHLEQLHKSEKKIIKLQKNIDVLTAQARVLEEDQQKVMEQKDKTIQRLHMEVAAARTNWDQYIKQVSSEMVVKDTEIITMQERETKLRTELENSREQIERYKQQVSTGLKRERTLEQIGVQAELEWQRRYEDIKAEHYLANEQLIQDLTEAGDQAKAELKEKQQELQDLNALLHSVRMERDHAVQGLTPKVDSLASEEINRLQVQNSTLRAVVTQMRKDMEGLSQLLPRPQPEPQASPPQPVHYPGSSAVTSNTLSANTQVATGLLAQTDAIFSKVGPAGANNPALIKQVRVTHVESAPTDTIQQSAPVQQFQEENKHLQLQALGLISGGLLEKVHCAKSNPSLLRARLKQAASCIARLSRDKQQLIEMGNRLRAQITTVGPMEPVEPERDTSTEKQGDQHDRLSVLEQLQYQLTTQELQYALKQRAGTAAQQLLPEPHSQGPLTKEPASANRGHKTTHRSESSINKESSSPLSQPHPHSGLSSEESLQSLEELWEMLDRGLSLSIFSEGEGELSRKEIHESGGSGVQKMLHSSGVIHIQPPSEAQPRRNLSKTSSNTTKTSRPGPPSRINKIRNYNVKD